MRPGKAKLLVTKSLCSRQSSRLSDPLFQSLLVALCSPHAQNWLILSCLFQMLHDILGHYHIQLNPHWLDISLNRDLVTELGLITDFGLATKFRVVSIEHLQRMTKWRLPLRSPGHVSFGTCICFSVEIFITWTCHVCGLWISSIPLYFYFALQYEKTKRRRSDSVLWQKPLHKRIFLQVSNTSIWKRLP